VVRHRRGGGVDLLACEHCTRAVRRLAASLGTGVVADAVEVVAAPRVAAAAVVPAAAPVPAAAAHGPPQLIDQLATEVVDVGGRRWAARVYGEPRADGTWVGWLQFSVIGGRAVRRTEQETSQPGRGALAYWASGLEPTYLAGAFRRACRRVR
jgi:hypothetical protein